VLKIDRVNTFYGNRQALWDVSIDVNDGEIVALLGANGAGKTTLLDAIVGINPLQSGEISFNGARLDGTNTGEVMEKGIAYLPEGGRLFPEMTISENLEMGAYPSSMWGGRKKQLEYVYTLFPKLRERRKQLARTLSGGEQQMLAMGRGLMSNPKLCLFDELSYGLAPIMVKEVFNIVRQLHEQHITVFLVEQNVKQTLEIADRAYVLENGRIVLEGECKDLLDNDYIKKAYLGL
jgi:branched-chain amino acid transport system ATP-binding protein